MQIHNAAVTGSLIYNGVDISSITGSTSNINSLNAITASLLSTTASLNSYTSSNDTNISNIHSTTASLNTFTGSAQSQLSALQVTSGSNITRISALESASGSAITRLSALEVTSGSNITRIGALETASGSAITRLNALEVTSGSNITRISALETASGSAITRLSALETASGSAITRLNAIEVVTGSNISRLSSLEARTGSYATTGSNTFVGGQYLSSSFNPTGFTTTASLYTDGGLRVGRDAYISGTLYLNNVTVYGTQSVCFITSSQLNISSNIISVNTATPSVRFGGLSVFDSGSTGLTGSILWDSQDNQWIYSNPSGSEYDSAMFLVGPRNTGVLGNEAGITCNFLSKGNGMHHMTSSGIFEDGSRTCFYGTTVIGSGGTVCTTMANASCVGIGTMTPTGRLTINVGTNQNVRVSCETHTAIQAVNDAANAYVPFKLDGSCLLLNTQSGGNIGIGTSSPGRTVHILGQTGIGTVLKLEGAAGTTTYLQLSYNGATNVQSGYIGYDSSANMALFTNDTERMRITSTGIACFACQVCSPSFIGGTVSGTTGTFSGKICANTAGTVTSGFADGLNLGSWDAVGYTSAGTDLVLGGYRASQWSGVQIHTSGASRLAVSSTGIACFACQVCSTTISATTEFRLGASFTRIATLDAGGSFGGGYNLNWNNGSPIHDSTGTISGYGYSNDGSIKLYTNSSQAANTAACERMRIISTGEVGIGVTPTAGNRFWVRGSSTSSGDTAIFAQNSGGTSLFTVKNNGEVQIPNGCVGINTTSPDTLLTIDTQIANFSTGTLARLYASKGTTEGAYLQIQATRHSTQSVRRVELYAYEGASCNANLVLQPNGGCAGVGTYVPGTTLEVRGTGNQALNSKGNLFVADGGTATQAAGEGGQLSFGAWLNGDLSAPYPLATIKGISECSQTNFNNGALIFGTMDSNTTVQERMRINSIGNVGIGTSTPLGTTAERTIHLSDGGCGYATVYVTNSTNAVRSIFGMQSVNGLGIVGTQTNNPFAIYTNDTERIRFTNTGIACFANVVCAPYVAITATTGVTPLVVDQNQSCGGYLRVGGDHRIANGATTMFEYVGTVPAGGNACVLVIPTQSQGNLHTRATFEIHGVSAEYNLNGTIKPFGGVFAIEYLNNVNVIQGFNLYGTLCGVSSTANCIRLSFNTQYNTGASCGITLRIKMLTTLPWTNYFNVMSMQ